MGSVYQGRWIISTNIVIDYVFNQTNNKKKLIEDVWVDLGQAVKILADDGRTVTNINKVWSINNNPYCPVLDFIHQTGLKTDNRSSLLKRILESLVTLALTPRDEETKSGHLIDFTELDESNSHDLEEPADLEQTNNLMFTHDLFDMEEKKEEKEDEYAMEVETKEPPAKRPRKKAKKKAFQAFHEPEVVMDENVKNESTDFKDFQDFDPASEDPDEYEPLGGVEDCVPLISCELCPAALKGGLNLYSHYRSQHPDQPDKHPAKPKSKHLECEECEEVFSIKRELKQHYRASHPDKVTEETNTQYLCNGCSKNFKTQGGLYRHCVEHHPETPDIWPDKVYKGSNIRLLDLHERTELRCGLPECGHVFSILKGLVRHERNHSEAFICVLCGKPCYSAETLIDHCETEHVEKSTYLCRVCGFFNFTETGLQLHTVQVHMKGTKEYSCKYCDYKTNNRSTYQNHTRVHVRGEKDFVCEECGKECATPQALSTHRLTHMARESFLYQCSYCPKRFPHVSLLKIHERVHTGEKPFQCKDCGQCFGSQSSLIKHNRNIHTPSDQMPYKCEECGKTFSKARRKVYLGHLKQHSGIRDHTCPMCKAAFSSRSYLCNHFKKVHRKKLSDVEDEMLKTGPLLIEQPDHLAFTLRTVKGYLDV